MNTRFRMPFWLAALAAVTLLLILVCCMGPNDDPEYTVGTALEKYIWQDGPIYAVTYYWPLVPGANHYDGRIENETFTTTELSRYCGIPYLDRVEWPLEMRLWAMDSANVVVYAFEPVLISRQQFELLEGSK